MKVAPKVNPAEVCSQFIDQSLLKAEPYIHSAPASVVVMRVRINSKM